MKLKVLSLRSELETANNELELSIVSASNRSFMSERPSLTPIDMEQETLRKKNTELERELEELRSYKYQVEKCISDGLLVPTGLKVVHMKENPYADVLAKRNQYQKQREEEVSRSQSASTGLMEDSLAPPVMTVSELAYKEEIEKLKKRLERMKELFTAQTNRFRDAV